MINRIQSHLALALKRAATFLDPTILPNLRVNSEARVPFDNETLSLWNIVKPRTMTGIERIDALRRAIEYTCANSIPGDIVECGVWRGGSMIAAAITLLRIGTIKKLWLYDTFSGMTPPGPGDVDYSGRSAQDLMAVANPDTSSIWAKSSLPYVRSGLLDTGFPEDKIEFVVGPVESTIPKNIPDAIALLRLDTDWFASTYHELTHLWPRLTTGGILIVDDYGYWAGAKKAVDQYFTEIGLNPYLHRIDETGRLIIKH